MADKHGERRAMAQARKRYGAVAWLAAGLGLAGQAQAADYDVFGDWPTHVVAADGTDFGIGVLYQYDLNRFKHDDGRLEDAQTNRRKYFGFYLRKPGLYDVNVQYDFQVRQWVDTFVRVRSKGLFGTDFGNFRLGYSKTPVGFEGVTSSGATTFIESALPTQAIWEGRRAGLDWSLIRRTWLINLGWYFWHKDLDGNNPGRTVAGRVAWVPVNRAGHVLHLGVSASRETLNWSGNDGDRVPPTARLRARPEDGLSPVRLIDSGALVNADHIDRRGVEALWIDGPLSAQGEYLDARVKRDGRPGYHASGYYAFVTWTLTGESRVYNDGNVADRRYRGRDLTAIKPRQRWGAVELALRYSRLDLDDGAITGGTEHDWTLGANWYLGEHLKFQTNYVWVSSDRRGVQLHPRVFEARAQLSF
ncbi:OprO/OprP family phosphate-selective porin [Frateuria defendens]|uniref:OprO/OprP family phosphate-selective porin n=1 Tax=Frateuria defendens TaxID=2219559 RepID=UPI001EFF5A3B|nr:porin [Frateuria defendens]